MVDSTSNKTKIYDPVDVFISYRRDGGATVASFLAAKMKDKGLSVFMDVESLETGAYADRIESAISSASNFVLIVTENVFQSEWVNKEILQALARKKDEPDDNKFRIIPIFANNLTNFPDAPSESIELLKEISQQNAITLNHTMFEKSLDDLFSRWLITRHNQFIDSWINYWGKRDDINVSSLLESLIETFPSTKPIVLDYLGRIFRQQWSKRRGKTRKAIQSLMNSTDIWSMKDFLEGMKINHRGPAPLMRANILRWLNNKDPIKKISECENNDRYEDLIGTLALWVYKDVGRRQDLVKLLEKNKVDLPNKQNSTDILKVLFDWHRLYSVKETLNLLNLSLQELKDTAQGCSISDAGTKSELMDRINNWVCYSIPTEDYCDE